MRLFFLPREMAAMKSLLCTAALLLGTLTLIVEFKQAEAQGCGGFQLTCNNIFLGTNGGLTASCYTNGGSLVGATLDLNNYIGNNDGSLGVGSNYIQTCQSISTFDQTTQFFIAGYCFDNNGVLQLTSYDIGSQVTNINGLLLWGFCSLKVSSSSAIEHTLAATE